MRTKAFVYFWGSTAASVLLLGSIWTLVGRLGKAGYGFADVTLLAIAAVGFCAAFSVAARIAYVVGRTKRAYRDDTLSEG